ncbi:ATP-binding protein [uncultured Veillonella sp.]|uniref:ATP-binding protein n=1 Tax=uncultured Veillonella sp. TaxID=159268 RepID=UPI00338F7CC3
MYFVKCYDLIQNLKREQLESFLPERIKHYPQYKVLIIDEIGYSLLHHSAVISILGESYRMKDHVIHNEKNDILT